MASSLPEHNIVHVGYSEPVYSKLAFNFHICLEDTRWVETIDYFTMIAFDSTINRDCDDFRHIQFLCFDNTELQKILKILISNEFSYDNLKYLERYRKITENWINFVFANPQKLHDECKQMLKQHFFRSQDKIATYETHFYNSVTKQNESIKPILNKAPTTTAVPKPQKIMKRMSMANVFGSKGDKLTLPTSSDPQVPKKRPSVFGGSNVGGSSGKPIWKGTQVGNNDTNNNTSHLAASVKDASTTPKMLLKIEVQRGQEARGHLSYDIMLRVLAGRRGKDVKEKPASKNPKEDEPVPFTSVTKVVSQRYSKFRKLLSDLTALNNEYAGSGSTTNVQESPRESEVCNESILSTGLPRPGSPYEDFLEIITAPFPFGLKSYLGISLNDTDLSTRTRMLDSWLRDICYNYRHFPPTGKKLVRNFLSFDMSEEKDIFIQDQLAWGLIEAPRGPPPMLIMQQSALQGEGVDGLLAHIDDNSTSVSSYHSAAKSKANGSVFGSPSANDGFNSLQNTIAETIRPSEISPDSRPAQGHRPRQSIQRRGHGKASSVI